jgi:tripartite-type tricarboxylate transporter receptor subunit TctC
MKRRALLAAALAAPAAAQPVPYPRLPLRLLVPYVPGGATDIQARALALRLGAIWGQQLLVENRAGGNTVVATEAVARAAPDGHTLLLAAMPFAVNPVLYDRLPFNTERDLAPVSSISQVPLALIVPADSPYQTLAQLLAAARARPGEQAYGSPGTGATPHLAAELLASRAGLELTHVPDRGGAAVHADLLAGRLAMVFDTGAWAQIAAGMVRALAVTTARRLYALPNVPTLAESGFPGLVMTSWHGVVTTGGTPPALVEWLAARVAEALRDRALAARFDALMAERVSMAPAEFRAFLAGEQARYGAVIKARGIRPEG